MTHLYLLLGCLVPFQLSRIYSSSFESEIRSLGNFSSAQVNFHMKAKFKLLSFNSIPATKFVETDALNQLVSSGISQIWSFITNQSYQSTWTVFTRSADASGQSWDDMIRRMLGQKFQTGTALEFIDKNPLLIAQTMLLVKLVKFCGVVFLCVGDTMVVNSAG